MKNRDLLDGLKFGDIVTFNDDSISWSSALWTVARSTDKAILIDDEWIPKSQIIDVEKVKRGTGDTLNGIKTVDVIKLQVSSWFDAKNHSNRPKGCMYAY